MSARRRKRRRRWNPRFVILCAALLALACGLAAGLFRWLTAGPPAEDTVLPDYVTEDLLTVNQWSRPGTPLEEINGIVIHYVGNPGPTARANHFVVGLEGEVLLCVPLTEEAYASNSRNGDTVSIEVCHPDDTGEFSTVTYDRVVELTAWLCREFRLDPERDVIRHYDVTGKLCPLYYVENPEAWDAFLSDVSAELAVLRQEKR